MDIPLQPPPYSPLVSEEPEAPPPYPTPSPTEDDASTNVSTNRQTVTATEEYVQVGASVHQTNTSAQAELANHTPPPPLQLRSSDHLILTIIMMIMCGVILNVLAFPFLIPALLYAREASVAKRSGHFLEARKLSQKSLWLNISSIIFFILLMVFGIILGAILTVTGMVT